MSGARTLKISLLVLVGAAVAATNYHRLKSIGFEPQTDAQTFTATIDRGCDEIEATFAAKLSGAFHGLTAERALTRDETVEVSWRTAAGQDGKNAATLVGGEDRVEAAFARNPELRAYWDTPPESRARDWMLLRGDDWWDSEYRYLGAPAPFGSDFIVHLDCAAPASTTVTVYEADPYVCVGEWFGLREISGHIGSRLALGFHKDCREVAPTRIDRAELLTLIKALVSPSAAASPPTS